MTESQRRDAFMRYFSATPNPSWPGWFLCLGIVLALAIRESPFVLAFAMMAAVGGAKLVRQRSNAVRDRDYDRLRGEVIDDLVKDNALRAWHIDMSTLTGNPQWRAIVAPVFPANPSKEVRAGGDNHLRYNPVRFVILGFGTQRLYMYGGKRDLIHGGLQDEWSTDRDPKHITVFRKTAPQTFEYLNTLHMLGDTEILELTIAGQPTISLPLRAPQLAPVLGLSGEIPKQDADQAIAALLDALR